MLKNCRINYTWNDWQHADKSIVLETNPSIYISLDDAIYLTVKELGRRVGRMAVTGWVKKNSLDVKAGERHGGQWLVRSDLFKQHLVQKKGKTRKDSSSCFRKTQVEIDSHLQTFLF